MRLKYAVCICQNNFFLSMKVLKVTCTTLLRMIAEKFTNNLTHSSQVPFGFSCMTGCNLSKMVLQAFCNTFFVAMLGNMACTTVYLYDTRCHICCWEYWIQATILIGWGNILLNLLIRQTNAKCQGVDKLNIKNFEVVKWASGKCE